MGQVLGVEARGLSSEEHYKNALKIVSKRNRKEIQKTKLMKGPNDVCHHCGLLHVDVIILPLPCPTVPIMVVVVAVIILLILVIALSQSCHFSLSSPQFHAIHCLLCAGHQLLALECWVSGAFRCWSSGSHCLHWPPAVLSSLLIVNSSKQYLKTLLVKRKRNKKEKTYLWPRRCHLSLGPVFPCLVCPSLSHSYCCRVGGWAHCYNMIII